MPSIDSSFVDFCRYFPLSSLFSSLSHFRHADYRVNVGRSVIRYAYHFLRRHHAFAARRYDAFRRFTSGTRLMLSSAFHQYYIISRDIIFAYFSPSRHAMLTLTRMLTLIKRAMIFSPLFTVISPATPPVLYLRWLLPPHTPLMMPPPLFADFRFRHFRAACVRCCTCGV